MGQLAEVVVLVGPRAVERSHRGAPAAAVVRVVETRQDRAVGLVIDQVQNLAGGVVLVGRINAVAQVLPGNATDGIVGVVDDLRVAFVSHAFQPADGVVMIVEPMAELVEARSPSPRGVVGELEPAPTGIRDLRQVVVGVVLVGGRAGGVDGAGKIAPGIVGVVAVRGVGVGLARNLPVGVVGVADHVPSAIGPAGGIAQGVIGPGFAASVGIGDAGQVAVGVVGVFGGVSVRVAQSGKPVERSGVGEVCGVAQCVGRADQVAPGVVAVGKRPASRIGDPREVVIGIERHLDGIAQAIFRLD